MPLYSRATSILLVCTPPHDCGRATFRPQLTQAHPWCCLLIAGSPLSNRLLVAHLQELVSADKEPIQPYINNISALAAKGVSSILVMGSSGYVCPVQLRHLICSSCVNSKLLLTALNQGVHATPLVCMLQHPNHLIFLDSWCSDYFSVADTVICMDSFAASDVTVEAKSIAQQHGAPAALQGATAFAPIRRRTLRDLLPGSGQGKQPVHVL